MCRHFLFFFLSSPGRRQWPRGRRRLSTTASRGTCRRWRTAACCCRRRRSCRRPPSATRPPPPPRRRRPRVADISCSSSASRRRSARRAEAAAATRTAPRSVLLALFIKGEEADTEPKRPIVCASSHKRERVAFSAYSIRWHDGQWSRQSFC